MKHTPGPWYLHPKQKVTLRGNCFHYRHDITGPEFAEPVASLYGNEKSEANARLIATSPELLEVLKLISSEADREAKNIGSSARRGDQSKADTFRFIRDRANQAIAKAEGK